MKPVTTTDIVFAAYLVTRGYKLADLTVVNKQGTFFFDNVSEQHVKEFDMGQALVEPVHFNTSLKQLATACKRY